MIPALLVRLHHLTITPKSPLGFRVRFRSIGNIPMFFFVRCQSSTDLSALVPDAFPSCFLPQVFHALRFQDCLLPLVRCTSVGWSSSSVCVFPSKGSVLFSLVSPMMSFPSLRPVCLLMVLPLPYHPHVLGRVLSVLLLILPLRSFRSVVVARGRCRSPPTPLHRSGKVNRAGGSP